MARTDVVTSRDWLLAEAVRLAEERHGRRRDDAVATRAGAAVDGGLAARIVVRARALPGADAVRADVGRVLGLLRSLVVALLLVAAITGMLAATASVADREINFLLAAAALLLIPTAMLVLWLGLVIAGARRGASGSIAGALLIAGGRRLAPRLLGSDHGPEVIEAVGDFLRASPGRWLLGCLAHAFWIVYLAAALLALVLYFSVVQYDLVWGTTLLSDAAMVTLLEGLAGPLAALGAMPAADPDWLLAGREGSAMAGDRARWAWFLLVVIAVYGLGPRLVALLVSAAMAGLGRRWLTLDTAQPGYLRLAGALVPAAAPTGDGQVPAREPTPPRSRPASPSGPPLLVGVELEHTPWPPHIAGIDAQPIGRADDRAEREQILAALQALAAPPPALLVLCSLLRTPDHGTERFINRAADAARSVPLLVLTDGTPLARRDGDTAARWADWRALAERTGGKAVELDLEWPEAAAIARLRRWIEGHDD